MRRDKAAIKDVLAVLQRRGTRKTIESLPRYGIVTTKAFGVPVTELKKMSRDLGRDHALATALWKSGWYEARLLAPFVGDPAKITPAQMDQWARDFDNWAVCDAACFHLFDRSPHAWSRIRAWSRSRDEFVKRGAFALLASVALHDKKASDAPFVRALPLIARAAHDERNFVKKGVSWALRSIGHRNAALHAAAVKLAASLADSDAASDRWIGRDALRDLNRPAVLKRVSKK